MARVRIGAYDCNHDKRPKFESLQEAKRARVHTANGSIWDEAVDEGYQPVLDI